MFLDRHDAGRRLAAHLEPYRDEHPVILGLPRGGVVIGFEVARALDAPLDALVVRKLGAPGFEEVAVGALAPGAIVLDQALLTRLGIPRTYLDDVIGREAAELSRRERLYRRREPVPVEGRVVILIDDGLATGATAEAAVRSLRSRHPRRIIFAAPVCSSEGAARLREHADEVVCLECPARMQAVGQWYQDFAPTSDDEVLDCLRIAEPRRVHA